MTKLFAPQPVDVPETLNQTEMLASQLVHRLDQLGFTVATAESLTGGLLSSSIVDIPGASKVFRGGVVSYSTDIKRDVLGVDGQLLGSGGPVQSEVAEQMALGVAGKMGANLAIATTGVAGPGDSPDGPQGLVYIAATLDRTVGKEGVPDLPRIAAGQKWNFQGTRDDIRSQSVDAALALGLNLLSQPQILEGADQ